MAERVIRMVVAFFVGIYVARYLGPQKFGLLNYALSFVGLFSPIAFLGLDEIVIRDLVKDSRWKEKILGSAFVLKIIGAVLAIVLMGIALQLIPNDRYTIFLILIIASGLFLHPFNVIDFYFKSQVLAKYAVTAMLCAFLFSSAFKLSLVAMRASLVWFAWASVMESLILSSSLVFLYRSQNHTPLKWQFRKSTAMNLLQNAWPVMLSGILIMVYLRIDQVMIKQMLNNESVGNYAAAASLSGACYFVSMAITLSLFPAVIRAKNMGPAYYHRKLQHLYDLMVWLSLAIALPVSIFAQELVVLFFGDAYSKAGPVLAIHIWATLFFSLMVASEKWLLAENLTKLLFYRTLVGAVGNVLLNLILIPAYGIIGAAISTVLAQFVVSYVYDLFHRSTLISFKMKSRAFLPIHLIRTLSRMSDERSW